MRISTEIASTAKLVGEERAVELLGKAGFTGWDLSMWDMVSYNWRTGCVEPSDHPLAGKDRLKFARQLRKIGADHGMVCNQGHAPFPMEKKDIFSRLEPAMECFAEAGGQILVIHPLIHARVEENARMYREFLPLAKQYGFCIATENLYDWPEGAQDCVFGACATPESFNALLDAVDDPDLVACLDIGHAEMRGQHTSAVELIHALGPRLQALHLHDTDRIHDNHQVPFTMDIDFAAVVKALKQVDYKGWLTLEADHCQDAYTAQTAHLGVQDLANAAKKLWKMFQEA